VGEVFIALRFIDELRRNFPDSGFILSTTTSTGYAQAKTKLADDDVLIYFPSDLPLIVRRVVRRLRPAALILTECELWPNILRRRYRDGIPAVEGNGRISESSYRGYRKVRPFFRRAVQWVDLLLVQSQLDYDRLLDLGANPQKVFIEGSAKYDAVTNIAGARGTAAAILRDAGMNPDGEFLVAGSTWPGEEKLLLDIFAQLQKKHPDLRLILVPRHMERRAEVEAAIRQSGLDYIKRTDMENNISSSSTPAVLLADTTGELTSYYSIATVVFVGKSMGENSGGQNPIEPAIFEKPIVVGPHMENFPGVMADFLAADALIQVDNETRLQEKISELMADAELRQQYGRKARELVESKRGAIKRSVARIQQSVPCS
jgi:3-deoxy-D-manno-octulosonic-acid transferase